MCTVDRVREFSSIDWEPERSQVMGNICKILGFWRLSPVYQPLTLQGELITRTLITWFTTDQTVQEGAVATIKRHFAQFPSCFSHYKQSKCHTESDEDDQRYQSRDSGLRRPTTENDRGCGIGRCSIWGSFEEEVGAGDSSLVGIVNDDWAVAEESSDAFFRACVFVRVRSREGVGGNLAMLSAQVTDLAGLR